MRQVISRLKHLHPSSTKSAFGSALRLFPRFLRLLQNVLYRLIYLLSIFFYILQQKFIMNTVIIKYINFPQRQTIIDGTF